MAENLNPQAEQMAHESMVRTLAAQADAIWPQESALFDRYRLAPSARILDAGCGTGEITSRLAERFPAARILGVDVLNSSLALARDRAARYGARVRFENRSVFDLGLQEGSFDLVVCRHVLHAIPRPERVLAELVRVTRRGGHLHLIAEDYGMIHFPRRRLDPDDLWGAGARAFGEATGTDLLVGRNCFAHLRALGLEDITIDYVIVDPLRVPRETFVAIWTAWCDGYAGAIGEHTPVTREQAEAHFADMIATLRDPIGYGVWMVPVIAAVVA